jgi:hypothetical protein
MSAAPKMPESWQNPKEETLFSLSADLRELDEALTDSLGELTPEIEARLIGLRGAFSDKIDGIGWFVRTCESREAGYKKLRDELQAKATTEANKVTRLKEYIRMCLDSLGTEKVKGEVYTLALQKNGGRPPVKLLEPYASDPDLLPRDLTRITVTPDMDRIRELPTPSEFYEVLPVGSHVRVR